MPGLLRRPRPDARNCRTLADARLGTVRGDRDRGAIIRDRQRTNACARGDVAHSDSVTRRTYLLWEPRFGPSPYEEDGALTFGGAGASFGMRWDRMAGATGAARTQFGALGGAFFGAGHAFAYGARPCDISFQPYISVAIESESSR